MTSEIESAMALMFRDATQQSVIAELRNDADWEVFNKIRDIANERERNLTERFKRDKDDLIARARQELIDQAGANTLEHPTPFGTDRFSKTEIERRATIQVENAHETQLQRIRSDEAEGYEELNNKIRAREGLAGHTLENVDRATEHVQDAGGRLPDRTR